MPPGHRFFKPLALTVFLFSAAVFCAAQAGSAAPPGRSTILHDVRPGPGVTRTAWLSEWFPPIAGTPVDTMVYILEGPKPGDTVFLGGGTHANEIAGIMTAVLLVEKARVVEGRLIVIPNMNNSAVTWNEKTGEPAWISLKTPSGTRFFKYGSRLTNLVHQGIADPARYIHPDSEELLPGNESRNLNRAHPGNPRGTITEQLAYAVTALIDGEKAAIAFDLHEAGPESRLANMIVAHPKNLDAGALAKLDLELGGLKMSLEPSSETFRGLSHREWGDATGAAVFLIETPNPGQGNASAFDTVDDPSYPLSGRVATHLATVLACISAQTLVSGSETPFTLEGLPEWQEILANGIGFYLR